MKIKIFWKRDCPNCPQAKKVGKLIKDIISVEYLDVDTVDGLAESCIFNVMATPSMVLVDDKNKEIESWRGVVPESDVIKRSISDKRKC